MVDCEATGEVPLPSSEPEQGVPVFDPEIWASSTSFDTEDVRSCAEIPSPMSSVGKSLMITFSTGHDMGSWPMERGEPSSGPSLQFAKKVLKSVLSSWIEALSSDYLELDSA